MNEIPWVQFGLGGLAIGAMYLLLKQFIAKRNGNGKEYQQTGALPKEYWEVILGRMESKLDAIWEKLKNL
jgi:hypothetical protein